MSQCEIEIFHDVEQRTLYLHLVTVHDGAMLCKLCEILNEDIPPAVSIPMLGPKYAYAFRVYLFVKKLFNFFDTMFGENTK